MKIWRIGAVTVLLACLVACSEMPRGDMAAPAALTLTDSLRRVVSLDTVRLAYLNSELLLNGRVDFDHEKVVQVYSPFSGRVEEVYVEVGDYVRQGEVLATLHSSEAAEIDKQKKTAEQDLLVARRNLEAVQDMGKAGMLSDRDLLQARREVADAEAEVARLEELDATYPLSGGTYQIKAPASGFVTVRNLNPNMVIRPDQEDGWFTVAGLEQVWIMADVYESDISQVQEGMPVRITTLSYGDREFRGTVDRIYHVLDPESKTMHVRVKLDNPDLSLKPGMFVSAYVKENRAGEQLPCVDESAVIFENNRYFTVRLQPSGVLSVQPVVIAKRKDGKCFLKEGISEGDVVLGRNALLVYNALK